MSLRDPTGKRSGHPGRGRELFRASRECHGMIEAPKRLPSPGGKSLIAPSGAGAVNALRQRGRIRTIRRAYQATGWRSS